MNHERPTKLITINSFFLQFISSIRNNLLEYEYEFNISLISHASAFTTLISSGTMTSHGRTSGWPKGTNPVSYAAKYGITNPSPTLDRPINL